MDELQRMAIVVDLCERMTAVGSWCGETHIQKSLYFVQHLVGVPTGFKFILYKFGPFSFDLRETLNVMVADKLLSQQIKSYPYGPSYAAADGGQRLLRVVRNDIGSYTNQVQFVADRLGTKGVAELERLATALFVWRKQHGDWANMAQGVHQLKPHVSLEKAGTAAAELRKIVGEYEQQGRPSAVVLH